MKYLLILLFSFNAFAAQTVLKPDNSNTEPTSYTPIFSSDISFNGTETSKAVDVSSVISDARTAIWQLKDAADDYNCVTVIIKTTQTTVTIEAYPALASGTYRLVGVE